MLDYKTFRGIGAAISQVIKDPASGELVAQTVLFVSHKNLVLTSAKAITYKESDRIDMAPWATGLYDARGIDKTGTSFPGVLSPKDVTDVGLTTLGPLGELPYGQYVGAIYLLDSHFDTLSDAGYFDGKEWDTKYAPRSYQWRSLVYSPDVNQNGGYAGRRYIGFHAIVAEQNPQSLVVTIRDNPQAGLVQFRIDEPSHCSPDGPLGNGEARLTQASTKNDEGALYIEQHRAADLSPRAEAPDGHGRLVGGGITQFLLAAGRRLAPGCSRQDRGP
ncbi:MAG: hypothetical protein IPL61_28255 [Myxococcales bacterium]|nr:hypothetical protein [Myxococcales bacterium]